MSIYILKSGEKRGPFTLQQAVESIKRGEFLLTDLSWREGATNWEPLHSMAEVVESALPPVPTSALLATNKGVAPQVPKAVKHFFIYWGLLALAGFIILQSQVFSFDWFFYTTSILATSFVIVAVVVAIGHSLSATEDHKLEQESPPIPNKLKIPSLLFGGACMAVGCILVLLALLFALEGFFPDKTSRQAFKGSDEGGLLSLGPNRKARAPDLESQVKLNFYGAFFAFAVGTGAFEIGRKAVRVGKAKTLKS